ncbi:DUF4190 domain-containing protein [Nocardioides litoris]|uniref:DUF4190 domain-containing protein n=1 Tax=Nocardioides litoris TaxID=1926648 RepID=UPI00111F1111|nr:DUF4190 domain-containing protein [Nocardioides litoris]
MTQPPEDRPDGSGRHDDPTVAPGSSDRWRPDLSKPASPSGDQAPPAPGWGQQGQPGPPPPPQVGWAPYGSPPPGPYGSAASGPTPYGGVPGYAGYPFARPHGGANTAMGLGITSLVCAFATFLCCVAVVGVAAGPFAIVLALRARKEMAASPGTFSNEGAATTGLVTGIIGTVLGLAGVAVAVFFIGAFWIAGSTSP